MITDIDGNYKLEAPFGSSLQISYIGYTTQTVKAGQKSIIKMKEDSKTLEEVVVVGYGVMKKKDLTGAVASLKASDLEKEQPKTVQDMLRTGVAGLSVRPDPRQPGRARPGAGWHSARSYSQTDKRITQWCVKCSNSFPPSGPKGQYHCNILWDKMGENTLFLQIRAF